MERDLSPEQPEESQETPSGLVNTLDSRHSEAGSSSRSSHDSPVLSPSTNHAMTSSMISNLNLGSDDGQQEEASHVISSLPITAGNGRAKPLTARDLLDQLASSSSASSSSTSLNNSASSHSTPKADEGSFLSSHLETEDALQLPTDAQESEMSHQSPPNMIISPSRRSTSSAATSSPNRRDASFRLDPDADTVKSVQGRPFRPASSSLSTHRHHREGSSSSSSHAHSRSVYEEEESLAPSHATAATGGPKTSETNSAHTQTVPSVSATGMPRFLPRRTSRSPSAESDSVHSSTSSHAPAPHEMMPAYPPSGSLTIAIFAKGISWKRRGYLLLASIAINIGLPFINGVMLGFGEIFARTIVAPYIGLTPAAININAPGPRRAKAANTGGAGLRYAGVAESQGSGGQAVSIESWEVEPGQKGKGRSRLI